MKSNSKKKEIRSLVVYGYTEQEIINALNSLKNDFSPNVSVTFKSKYNLTTINIEGCNGGIELLRFNVNKAHRILCERFKDGLLSTENKNISEILGDILLENELSISSAESCTGGNIANKIVQTSGSSAYFLGSVVCYSNNAKAEVLKVNRQLIDQNGSVSKDVTEAMAQGIMNIMHSNCAIATSGIAGPTGGSKLKPVGTVWITVKCEDNIYSECKKFGGKRNDVIEAASIHAIALMINFIKEKFALPEESNDE